MLQSKRFYLPEILALSFDEFLKKLPNYDAIYLAEAAGDSEIKTSAKSIIFLVGPEGGFTQEEIKIFLNNGAKLFSLGKNRLRSETAVIAGIVKILSAYNII